MQRTAEGKTLFLGRPTRLLLGTIGGRFSLPALVAQLIWGLNVSTMKIAISDLDACLIGMVRNFVAGLILMAVLARVEGRVGLEARHWPRMVVVAVLGMGLNTILWQSGLERSTATNAALISSVSPIFALTMAVAIGQEILMVRRVIGMLLALVGVVLVIQTDGFAFTSSSTIGNLLLLGCAGTWAAYNVIGVPLLRYYSPLKVTAWSMLLGSAAMVLASPFSVKNWSVAHASPIAWFGVAYAVVFGTIIAQTLWTRALHTLGASNTMIYSYLSPVLAVAFAALLLAERVTVFQAAGAVFVLTGVTLSNGVRRSRA